MPDLNFMDSNPAEAFCRAPDYPARSREAILEMHCQFSDLVTDENDLAARGLLIRHLAMPQGLAGTEKAISFLVLLSSPRKLHKPQTQLRNVGYQNKSDQQYDQERHSSFVKSEYGLVEPR